MTPTEIGALASCPALSIAMGLVAARGTRVSFSLRIAMWALPVVAVVTAHVATLEVSGLFRTLAITTVLFISMKALVTLEDRVRGMSPMKTAQWLRFALGWVGMTPKVFATRNKTPAPHQVRQCLHACLFIAVGVAIFVALRYSSALRSTYLVVMPLALLGLVLVMHSGVLAILATLWRAAGMNVAPVMRAPVASKGQCLHCGARVRELRWAQRRDAPGAQIVANLWRQFDVWLARLKRLFCLCHG